MSEMRFELHGQTQSTNITVISVTRNSAMTTVAPSEPRSGPLEHFEHGFNRVAVSPDSTMIATGDVDMNVIARKSGDIVFEASFESENEKIRPTERIRGLVFSADATALYVAAGSILSALNTTDWAPKWTYEAPRSFGFLIISPISVDAAANGDVAAAFDNGSIVVWDSVGKKKQIVHDNDSPRWMRFGATEEELIGCDGFSLCKWDLSRKKRKAKIQLKERVFAMEVHRSGQFAATRTLQDVVLWDLATMSVVARIPVRPGIPVLAFHPTQKRIAFAERNCVKVADFGGQVVEQFDLAVASALSMQYTASGEEILIGCTEHKLLRRRLK